MAILYILSFELLSYKKACNECFLFWKRNLWAFIWGVSQLFLTKIEKVTSILLLPFINTDFDDVIDKIWWRHHKNQNAMYIVLILVRCTTKLPSLVAFGQILQQITGVGEFTYPPSQRTCQTSPRIGLRASKDETKLSQSYKNYTFTHGF